jgi:hypothetical protein
LNAAYNELLRELVIKTINKAHGVGADADEKVLGFGTLDELLEAIRDKQKLSDTYHTRRSIIDKEIEYLENGEDPKKNEKKLEEANKALQSWEGEGA